MAMGMKAKVALALPLCIAAGYIVGRLLVFTSLQSVAMIVSVCLLAEFLIGHFGKGVPQPLVPPAYKLGLFGAFLILLWISFTTDLTGGLTGTPALDAPYVQVPRVLSMIVALLPAVPFGAAGVVGLLAGGRDEAA